MHFPDHKLVALRWVTAASTYNIPAVSLRGGGWEFANGEWRSFQRKPKAEQLEWAREYVGSGIREPIEATLFSDGGFAFNDGHHRVMAGTVLNISIPVKITYSKLKGEHLPAYLKLAEAGFSGKQVNPQGWNLNNSGIPPLDVVRKGPKASDEWIMSHEA